MPTGTPLVGRRPGLRSARAMTPRARWTLPLTIAAVLLIAFAPGHPSLRGPLVERVVDALGGAGVTLRYDTSSGNLWRGVTLEQVRLEADGLDLELQRLELGWFLPPLLTGELPLRLRLESLTGDVDVEQVLAALVSGADPAAATALPLRLRWQEVVAQDAAVRLAGVPFTLPDVAIEDLTVAGGGAAITFDATLRTGDGRVPLSGEVDPSDGSLRLEVIDADARVARHWWDGVEAGRVHGTLLFAQGALQVDATVERGAIAAFGASLDAIRGPVSFDGREVRSQLTGRALNGQLEAGVRVDVQAQRWRAEGAVDVDVRELTPLLWSLGAAGAAPPTSGRAVGSVRVSGWSELELEVDAVVDGEVYGVPLRELATEVRFAAGRLQVEAAGSLAEGALELRIDSAGGVVDLVTDLRGAAWGPLRVDDLGGSVRLGAEQAGSLRFNAALALADGVPLRGDLSLDADAAVLYLESDAVAGARVQGAASVPRLTGDAPLQGQLQLELPAAWWSGETPLGTLVLGGSLAQPSARLELDAAGPVRPASGAWLFDDDLRGALDLALTEGGVRVDGALGPLELDGVVGAQSRLRIALAPLDWLGPTPLRSPALDLELSAEDDAWSLRDAAGRLAATLRGDGWSLDVAALPVSVGGVALLLDGAASGAAGAFDADARVGDVALRASSAAQVTTVRVASGAEALTAVGGADGWELRGGLELAPLAALAAPDAAIAGRLDADLQLRADGSADGEVIAAVSAPLAASLRVSGDAEGLRLDASAALAGEPLTLQGRLTPAPLLEATLGPFGPIAVDGDGAAGAGVSSDIGLGPATIAPQPWTLRADPAVARADLRWGESLLEVDWSSALTASAALRLPARLPSGGELVLAGTLGWSAAEPDGALDLTLSSDHAATLLTLRGDLRGAELAGTAPASAWSALLGDALEARGELSLHGRLALLAGDGEASAAWTAPDGASLRASASVDAGALRWELLGDGLDATGTRVEWRLSADAFDPGRWLERPALSARLSGELSGASAAGAAWQGLMEVEASTPLPFTGALRGEGAALTLRGAGRLPGAPLLLSAEGRWDGHLDATLQAAAADDAPEALRQADATLRVRMDQAGLRGEGDLRLAAGSVGPLTWPSLEADLAFDGAALQVVGSGGRWSSGSGLGTGVYEHPLELAGVTHLLTVDPERDALVQLRGELLSADVRLDATLGWRATLSSDDPTPLVAALGGDAAAELLTLRGLAATLAPAPDTPGALDLQLDGRWRPSADLDLALTLNASGTLSDARGSGSIGSDGTPRAALSFELAPDALSLDADLDGLGPALRLALRLQGEGWSADLRERDGPWSATLDGRIGAEQLASVAITGPDTSLRGTFETTTALALTGSLLERDSALHVTGALDDLSASLRWGADEVDLRYRPDATELRARVGALDLALRGPSDPLRLDGTLSLDAATLPLTLLSPDAGDPHWRAVLDDALVVRWEGDGARLSGSSEVTLAGVGLGYDGDLRWAPSDGFAGAATLRLHGLPAGVVLDTHVAGAGPLDVRLDVALEGRSVGAALGHLAADPREGWEFDLDLDVPLAGAGLDTWRLAISGRSSGTPAAPRLDASLALLGPVTAHGRAWLDDGAVRADLVGRALSASARLDEAGGRAQLRLSDADVAAWLPWLDAPRLDLALDARTLDGGIEAVAEGVRLRLPHGEVGGQGRLSADGAVTLTLRSDLDLADLRLGPALEGRLRGPVTVSTALERLADDASVAGVLVLEGGRVEGLEGRFDGDVQVAGPASDPRVSLALIANDGASGSLRATLHPNRVSAQVDADLSVADLRLVLRSQLTPELLQANGRLVLGAAPPIEIRSDAGVVTLSRSGDPTALQLSLAREPWRLELRSDLARLGDGAAGVLAAALVWDDGPWPLLDGSVRALEAAGVALGDWRLSHDAEAPGRYQAVGDAGALSLDAETLHWGGWLEPLTLPLGDADARARLELEGRGAEADVTLELSTLVAGAPLDVRADGRVDAGSGAAVLAVGGSVAGGSLTGGVQRSATEGWQGSLSVQGAVVAERELRATLHPSGVSWVPTLAASVELGEEFSLDARFDGADLSLDAAFATAAGPLRVSGGVWPQLALDLEGPDPTLGALTLRGSYADASAPLRVSGALRVPFGPLSASLSGAPDGALLARLESDLVDAGALLARLPAAPLRDTIADLSEGGVTFDGVDGIAGSVALRAPSDGIRVDISALELGLGGVPLRLDGAARAPSELEVTARADLTTLDTSAAWWPRGLTLDAPLIGALRLLDERLVLTTSDPWGLRLELDLATLEGSLVAELAWRDGDGASSASADLRLGTEGVGGRLDLSGVRFGGGERAPLQLDGSLTGAGRDLDVDLQLRSARSNASLRGRLPLTLLTDDASPSARPAGLDLRVAALDLRDIPGIEANAPFVAGVVSGSVVLRGDQLAGQLLANDMRLAERPLPLVVTVAGDLSLPHVDVRLETGSVLSAERSAASGRGSAVSSAALAWDGERVTSLVRLERFPVHALVEAVVGPSDVATEVTGVVRAGWSPSGAEPLDLRVATELVRLERAGVVTVGQAAFELADGALRIQQASFEGRGAWRASGEVRPERIDLELVAEDADFGPLLGLVPVLARYAVGAQGDLVLRGSGTLAQPQLSLRSERLRVDVAGTSYELSGADARLEGQRLSLDASLAALEPVTGSLTVRGDGSVRLAPFELGDLTLRALGAFDVPLVGRVSDVDATLQRGRDASTALRIDGSIGAPFSVEGSLTPFDLRAQGRGLQLAVPQLFVADSVLDADLRVRLEEGLQLSGRVDASSVRIDLGARAAAVALESGAGPTPAELAARRAAQALVIFDDVRLVAPQRVTLNETLGSGEAAFDLTLSGSVAEPRLSGGASALRGTLRFSGRDFELVRTEASFEPTRGVLPQLSIEARTSFDKARVLVPGSAVTFAAPPGPRFEVRLAFDADVVSDPSGELTLDLVPRLSSDASIEVGAGPDGLSAGSRALTDLELLGLIALGRLEPGGGGAFAGAVAQSALDTAVDLLVVSELQAALSEALGIDLVEIRTSALGDLIGGATDPFSVSLRFGGYLSDELFASYRVGTFDDAERAFAFTNELVLTYELGPVSFDLAGSLDFPIAGTGQPVPGVSAGVRYDITRSFALEAGVELGSERQTARLGVTLRW